MEVSKFKIGSDIIDIKDAQARDDVVAAMNAAQDAQSTADQAVNGLASKQNTITGANYTGNVDDLTTTSMVWCAAANVTGTLPFTTGYFMIETFRGYNFNQYVQKAYKYDPAGIPSVAFRIYVNNQWYPWKSITLS